MKILLILIGLISATLAEAQYLPNIVLSTNGGAISLFAYVTNVPQSCISNLQSDLANFFNSTNSFYRNSNPSNFVSVAFGSGVSGSTNGQVVTIVGAQTNRIPSIIETNFISGRLYTNGYGSSIYVSANVSRTLTGISGLAQMALWIPGVITNQCGESTLLLSLSVNKTDTLAGVVPEGGTYAFTNLSTGAGNSSAITSGTIVVY